MDVNSFLGALSAPVKVTEGARDGSSAVTRVVPESPQTHDLPPSATEEPGYGPVDDLLPQESQIVTDTTPSGIVVAYQSKPKRLYRVNGVEVPSVTTVLDVLNKGGLTVWGMRVGIKGVLGLLEGGHLESAYDWDADHERLAFAEGEYADDVSVEALMKEHLLTTDKVKDSAADRGNVVHKALETWATSGQIPNPDDFDEREKGYVQGIAAFLTDADPEPVRTEVMVASAKYGFAGRYDLELRFKETKRVRLTPKQKWHEVEPGVLLVDCKSAKNVYPDSNFRQLAAYEGARLESGYEPTDAQYVLNVNGEGSYAFVKSTAVLGDYLDVLAVYHGNRRLKKAA